MNKEEHSLLYVAARNGHLGVVQWLVVNGADMDLQCKYSQSTPLHAAAFYGHASVVRYIVTAECRKDIVNKYGSTAAKEAKTDEIRRCIERPTRGGAGRFTVKKDEVPAFDLDTKKSYSKVPFKDDEWIVKSFENRFKMVMQFKKMGDDFKKVFAHLKKEAETGDRKKWAIALVYVYTLQTPLYGRMNVDLLVENELTQFKWYLNALTGALRLLSAFEDPRVNVDAGTVLYRSAHLSVDQIDSFKKCIGHPVVWKSFTSTTRSKSLCEAWNNMGGMNVIFEITVKYPRFYCFDISSFSFYPNECEVLLRRSTRIAIISVENQKINKDKWVIKVENSI